MALVQTPLPGTHALAYSPVLLVAGVLPPLNPMVVSIPAVLLFPEMLPLSQFISCPNREILAPPALTLLPETLTYINNPLVLPPPPLLGPFRQQLPPQPTPAPHHTPPSPIETIPHPIYLHQLGTTTQIPLGVLPLLMQIL